MSGKISEYTNEALAIGDDDWFDISVDTGSGFESRKLKGSTIKALISLGVNLATSDLTQTDTSRVYNCDGKDTSFINGKTFSVSSTIINLTKTTVSDALIVDGRFTTEESIFELGAQLINTTGTAIADAASLVLVGSTSSAIEITLPSASAFIGRKITVMDVRGTSEANNITITPSGVQTINGAANAVLSEDFSWLVLHSDGSNWIARRSENRQLTGWASYEDNSYLASTVAATPLQLTFGKPIALESEIPNGISTYWDVADHTIKGRLNDNVSIQLSFTAEPFAPNLYLDVYLDLGAGEVNLQTFGFPKGSGEATTIIYNLSSVNQLASWVANGAKIYVVSNGIVEISNPQLNINRNYKG